MLHCVCHKHPTAAIKENMEGQKNIFKTVSDKGREK